MRKKKIKTAAILNHHPQIKQEKNCALKFVLYFSFEPISSHPKHSSRTPYWHMMTGSHFGEHKTKFIVDFCCDLIKLCHLVMQTETQDKVKINVNIFF